MYDESISTIFNQVIDNCWQQMQAKPSSVRWPALFEPRWESVVFFEVACRPLTAFLHKSLSRKWNRYDWIRIDMTRLYYIDEMKRLDMSIMIEM